MTLPIFLTSAQVAHMIGYSSKSTFLQNRDYLETECLFPMPMPITRYRAFRWRQDEVAAWIERNGLPRAGIGQSNVHLIRLARTA